MSLRDEYLRVSKSKPCPICGKPDWCMIDRTNPGDPSRALCQRVGSGRRWGNAGWLHILRQDGANGRPSGRRIGSVPLDAGDPPEAGDEPTFGERHAVMVRNVDPERLRRLAEGLGVSVSSLRRLGVGYAGRGVWAFPMRRAAGRVCGLRLRSESGRKWAVTGSRDGLFYPPDQTADGSAGPLVITEGPTDSAALLDMGAPAVGRPSCEGCRSAAVEYCRRGGWRDVVIFSDADGPGVAGAERLADALLRVATVRLVQPPHGFKDARAWRRAGAVAANLAALIHSANERRLCVAGGAT